MNITAFSGILISLSSEINFSAQTHIKLMKSLVLAAILLLSPAVQADQVCDDLYELITGLEPQLSDLYTLMMLKERAYISTTERVFPLRKEKRRKDYERHVLMYNRQYNSYEQLVAHYRDNCE